MNDLVESLAGSFSVSNNALCSTNEHPRLGQFKNRGMHEFNQEKRRAEYMQKQKDDRFDRTMKARNLAMNEGVDDDEEVDVEAEGMDCTTKTQSHGKSRKNRNRYKDQLMLSEWMITKPDDFEKDWMVVFCPQGRRCLVVAAKSQTTAYTKSGAYMNSFKSQLPGGNNKTSHGYTLLDCIYSEVDRKYYVLDILCWNGHSVLDSDTEFRFIWGLSNINDEPSLGQTSKAHNYPFVVLPRGECSNENIGRMLKEELPFKAPLDGLLFYMKSAVYWQETTPLVTWLKPFMVPEILQVEVPDKFTSDETAATFREHFEESRKRPQKTKSP